MLSAVCFNLDQSKILSSGNGLIHYTCNDIPKDADIHNLNGLKAALQVLPYDFKMILTHYHMIKF